MFGWLFLTPAQADDPIAVAATQISDLKTKVTTLVDQTKTLELISIAESKYNDAVLARDAKLSSQISYDNALSAESSALIDMNAAQARVDQQAIVVNNKLNAKDNAKNILDLAIISLDAQQALINSMQSITPGLNYDVYNCWTPYNTYNNAPPMGCNSSPVATLLSSDINFMWGGGGPAGTVGDDYQVHWYGYIKGTIHWTPQFRICSDDGGRIYLNGQLIVNDWWDRGFSCGNVYAYYMSSDAWIPLDVWFYENGGGAGVQLQWNIGNGWQVITADRFAVFTQSAPQSELDKLNQLTLEKNTAQTNYDIALAEYNLEYQNLQMMLNDLNLKQSKYQLSQQLSATTLSIRNSCELDYNNKVLLLNDAIDAAWKEYNSQWQFEEQQRVAAAIAQALANQPQPTPIPTIAPSPLPTPEQTLPVETIPTPTPEITTVVTPDPTPIAEPSVIPTPAPSPQITDIAPSPTTQPTTDPVSTPDKSTNSPVDEQTANLIADLTNSNTLTKLTPEQRAKVAGTLGIKSNEIIKVAELAKSNPSVAEALQQFGDRANANLSAPMPYTLADATTEVQAEKFLSDPLSIFTNIDLTKLLSPSEWGKDMTDDQREKTQEVVIPVIIASNLVAAAMIRRI
jgi:hypothetical protein